MELDPSSPITTKGLSFLLIYYRLIMSISYVKEDTIPKMPKDFMKVNDTLHI